MVEEVNCIILLDQMDSTITIKTTATISLPITRYSTLGK